MAKEKEEIEEKETTDMKETDDSKTGDVVPIEAVTEEKSESQPDETTTETELENDPWSEESWKEVFPELYEKDETEKQNALTEADVIRIVRDQIKKYVAGVKAGKYPFPAGEKEPTKYPYPEKKEFEELKSTLDELQKSLTDRDEKVNTLTKSLNEATESLGETKKELQSIKDEPVKIIEKELKDEKPKKRSPYVDTKSGGITLRK